MFQEQLENGLIFRTIQNEADIERYITFNTVFNNQMEGLNTNCLVRHFPGARLDDYQLIEDPKTNEIVATTCLIPWAISYDGITLQAGQLEQVLSHPDYRRHGLVRTQMKRFMQVVRERQLDISFIWGIPYYYRQYGYTYCLDGNTFESLPAWKARKLDQRGKSLFKFRAGMVSDSALLTSLYEEAASQQQVHLVRTQDHWHYLLEQAKFQVQIIEEARSGQPVGYIGLFSPNAERVNVIESSITNADAAMAVLKQLASMAGQEIQVCWPKNSSLAQAAQTLGSLTEPGGQWLIHITDPASFLSKIRPVLESRLAHSDCAGTTTNITINLFRQAYQICITEGRLSQVNSLGFVDSSMGADGGDICIPPEAFVRLVFGFRSLDELFDAWPDMVIKPESRRIIEVLFPRMSAYLYATYKYFG